MITAVDTNVLLDVLGADAAYGPRSADVLRASLQQGRVIACEVVWAETAAWFATPQEAHDVLERLGVGFSAIDASAASRAGRAWRAYRRSGGNRQRVVADFLIGSHALEHADRLLTRDRGFYHARFEELEILDPSR